MNVDCEWPTPTSELSLSGDDVHVWFACLNQFDTYVDQMAQILSADELKRAERFHFRQHRNQFITAHGLLRKLLAGYTNIAFDRITFEYGRKGKPFLSEKFNKEKIRFNLSHSNGYALFAFSCKREIGVDLEKICEFADMDKVAEQVFSTKEIAVFRSFSESEKNKAFFIFWARKEAYLKAVGEGFSADLDAIDISSCTDNASVRVNTEKNADEKTHWTIQDLRPVPGFAAAYAIEGGKVRHRCWRIPRGKWEKFLSIGKEKQDVFAERA